MKSFIYIPLIVFVLFFARCKKDYLISPIPNGVPAIIVKDSNGNNLLNPEYENAFDVKSIRIYYIRDGKEKLQVNNIKDNMYFYNITNYNNQYIIEIYIDFSAKQTTTLIKWNEYDTDTLICNIKKGGLITKILFNNELEWEDPSGRNRPYFTIIK